MYLRRLVVNNTVLVRIINTFCGEDFAEYTDSLVVASFSARVTKKNSPGVDLVPQKKELWEEAPPRTASDMRARRCPCLGHLGLFVV